MVGFEDHGQYLYELFAIFSHQFFYVLLQSRLNEFVLLIVVAVVDGLEESSVENGHSETENRLLFEGVFVIGLVEIIYFFRCIVDIFVDDASVVFGDHVIVYDFE